MDDRLEILIRAAEALADAVELDQRAYGRYADLIEDIRNAITNAKE